MPGGYLYPINKIFHLLREPLSGNSPGRGKRREAKRGSCPLLAKTATPFTFTGYRETDSGI